MSGEYLTVPCPRCGILFAVPEHYVNERHEDHRAFWCPNGHRIHFPDKTETDRLRDQLAAEQSRHDQTRAALESMKQQAARR